MDGTGRAVGQTAVTLTASELAPLDAPLDRRALARRGGRPGAGRTAARSSRSRRSRGPAGGASWSARRSTSRVVSRSRSTCWSRTRTGPAWTRRPPSRPPRRRSRRRSTGWSGCAPSASATPWRTAPAAWSSRRPATSRRTASSSSTAEGDASIAVGPVQAFRRLEEPWRTVRRSAPFRYPTYRVTYEGATAQRLGHEIDAGRPAGPDPRVLRPARPRLVLLVAGHRRRAAPPRGDGRDVALHDDASTTPSTSRPRSPSRSRRATPGARPGGVVTGGSPIRTAISSSHGQSTVT